MPQPIKGEINAAVERYLATNCPALLEEVFINSLLFATGLKVTIEPEGAIFKCCVWRFDKI